jgi:hypothetical protein
LRIKNNLPGFFKYWNLNDAKKFAESGKSLKIQELSLKYGNLEEVKWHFSITNNNIFYHDQFNVYDKTYGELHELMLYNNYHYVRFPCTNLTDVEKIHIFKQLVYMNIPFLPLYHGFYTNSNISVDIEICD